MTGSEVQQGLRIVTVAAATAEHPRQSEAGVMERADGALFVAYEEFDASAKGSEDDAPNRIVGKVSRDGGLTWGERRSLFEMEPGDMNLYCPSLVAAADGRDWLLFFYRQHVIERGKPLDTTGLMVRSSDEGETFGAEMAVWKRRPLATTPSAVKRLASGRLVHPVHGHEGKMWTDSDHIACSCFVSDDDGRTWRQGAATSVPLRGAMEPHVEELRDGRVMMVMRTQLGAVFQAFSEDGGLTWSKPQTTGLRAPEATAALYRIPQTGDLCMIWNDAPYEPDFRSHFGKRSPLTVALSDDEGKTWSRRINIEDDPRRAYTNAGLTITRGGVAILTYWTLEYAADWAMAGTIDLRAAVFEVQWLYGQMEPRKKAELLATDGRG